MENQLTAMASVGHGLKTLASIFLTFNLLAFAFHATAYLVALDRRAVVAACGATYRFFENPRTITAYVVFQDRSHLLQAIAAADPARPHVVQYPGATYNPLNPGAGPEKVIRPLI